MRLINRGQMRVRLMRPIIRDDDRSIIMIMDFRVFFKLGFIRPDRLLRQPAAEALHLRAGGIDAPAGFARERFEPRLLLLERYGLLCKLCFEARFVQPRKRALCCARYNLSALRYSAAASHIP